MAADGTNPFADIPVTRKPVAASDPFADIPVTRAPLAVAPAESQTFVPFPTQPSTLDSIVNGAENFGASLGDTALQAGSQAAGALDLAGHTALYPFLSDQQRDAALSAAQTEFQQAQDYGQAAASHTGITGGAGRLVGGLGTFVASAAGSPAYSGANTVQHGGSVGQAEANLGTDAAAQELFMALGGGKPGANGVKNRLLNLLLGGAEKTRLGAGVGAAARTVGVSAAQQATQHAIDPNTIPAVNLGDVVTNPAPYVVAALSALGHGAGGAEAAKPATKPAPMSADDVAAYMRAAGVPEDRIQEALKSGELDDVAAAVTPAPRPALQGPPPESPLPVAATRALPAPEPEAPALPALPPPPRRLAPPTVAVDSEGNAITNAQAMEQARAADAAAQKRQNLGLTPDVERAQQARQEGVKATEAESLAHGAPGESPIPEVPEKPSAPVDPAVEQHYFDDIGNEIGWDQEGGHILRGSGGGQAVGGEAVIGGNVTGRTTWIGKPRVDGNGESDFWRNRPPNARLTPDRARAALAKYQAGEPLKPVEQRFVDYARQQAHEYAQEHADETARQVSQQRDMDQEAIAEQYRALNEDANVHPQDFGEALTLQQWVERAHNAGATREEVTGALEQSPNESAGAVRALARLVHEKEGGHAADTRATSGDREPGVRPGGTGRTVPDAEAGAGIEESQGPRGDLFGAATSAERIRAAREAKDAERNGLNREGRNDIHAGGGTLFEGRAPEQVDIPENAAQDTSYGNTVAIPSGAKRNGNTVAEPGIASRGRPGPEIQGQLDFFAAKDAPQAVRRSARNFSQHAKNVQIGTFKTGVTNVLTAQDAAHVIAPIRKNAYEHMVALVLDADARPLAVIQHTSGTIDGAGVYPGDLFGEIASVPGARSVWLAHNHPSGVIEQSGADRNITSRISELLRGSGIDVRGMLVVGPGNKRATLFHPEYSNVGERGRHFNGTVDSARDITAASRHEDVPVMGRKLARIPSQQERMTLTSPRSVVAWANDHVDGPGIILLDNRHRVLGFAPLDEQEMALLRTGDASRGSAEVARQVKGANAAAAIVVSNNLTDAQNVGALLRDLSVRPLDILEGKQGKYESAASRGLSLASPDFHSEEPGPEVSESSLSHEDQQLVQQTRERASRQQDNRSLEDVESDESRQRGEQEAGDLGLRGAVVDALGERAGRVHFVHDALGLPKDVRQRMAYTAPIKRGNVRYGLMTADGEAYIFTDHANTPERAVWTAIHEVGGHAGVRELVNAHPDVKVGKRTVKDAYAAARNLFLQNPTVRALAEVIAKQRGSKDLPRMAEEAMAELQAATRTGRWDEITRKYGVDVPKGVREGVQGAIANFVRRLKAILNAIHAKVTGKSDAFTDTDVHDMLGRMFEAAKDERGGEDLASEEPRDRAGEMGHGASGPAPEGETTGIKNAQTKAERIARGLDELDAEGRRSFGTVWETAAGKLHDEPMAGQLLADEIARNPRPLKPEETALLAQDRARILVQRRKAAQESIDAAGDETAQAIAQAKLDLANQQLEVNDKAARQSGYEQGLGLAMRKAMAALDYSLDAMEQRMEAAKGRPLTPEEHKTLADLDAKLRAADEQVQAAKGTARMAGRATKGDLQAQLRLFADELHEAVSKRDRIRQNQLRKQIRETAERIAKGDFAEKPKRQPFAYNEETRRLEAERNKLRRKFDRMAERARMQQWSRPRRAFEFLYELRRAIILSGLHTLGKLTTAALYRVGLSPLEHLVQSGLGAIPGIHKIAARAPLEGGFSPGAELAGMKALFSKETLAEMGRKFGDRGIYDLMYGKNHASLYPWLDLVGQVHGALKVPEERTAFAVALTKFIKFERKQAKAQGLSEPAILDHLSRPDVQARLEAAAYAESKRSIFMQDNAVVSGMRGLESMLRNAGKNKAGGKLLAPLADVMHWMFPIVRVPSNYIGEAFSYLGGGAKAAAELAASGALKKGVDALTPEQADYIMRNLGKQTVGAALLALGYFGYQAFPGKIGTWYQQGDNKRRGVPKEGSIFGVPQYLAEHPAFFMVTIGANFRRVVEGMKTKTGKTMVGTGTVSDAALNSMVGLLRQTPFMYPFENLQDKTRNAGAFGKFVSDETVGSYVPPDLRRFASAHDTDSAGKPIKRYPHGFVDGLKMNVPGLREQVPTKRNPNR